VADQLSVLRRDVRGFLAAALADGDFEPRPDSWLSGWDPEFSRRLAEHGWVGMTIPIRYGGRGRTFLERQVVIEELLAVGAPVAAHWMADRQIGPAILRHGTEEQRRRYLPEICAGRFFFAIGMSEPDSGSDLASVRTRAVEAGGGWVLNGTKVWTSGAHRSQAILVLARTGSPGHDRHAGLTQFVVATDAPGVTIRPIRLLTGEHHFNEVHFADVHVPADAVLGAVGGGWAQVMAELGFERSGPERFLSTLPLLEAAGRVAGVRGQAPLGLAIGRLWALHHASSDVAAALSADRAPGVEGPIVKDVGTVFESTVIETVRELLAATGEDPNRSEVERLLATATLHSPGFTLRGGTNEVLRTLIAKALVAG
jgi:acyl-CoA dehydrogenase